MMRQPKATVLCALVMHAVHAWVYLIDECQLQMNLNYFSAINTLYIARENWRARGRAHMATTS